MKSQEKVRNLYDVAREKFYLCRDDLTVGGEKFNSALLLGTLTELNRGKQLLFGEYGGGKTTSAEYLHSLFQNLPVDIVRRVVIRGSPQLTQEKMIGRPDYGKMHLGKEDVVWQHFVLIPGKIIDEFNRIPESNQSMLLDGIDRGEWGYLNEHIATGKQPFFATCNYDDRGNNTLIPPILDRFDVATESKFPGVANRIAIGYDYHSDKDALLLDPETSREIMALLNGQHQYDKVRGDLRGLKEKFRKRLGERNLETLAEDELGAIEKEIGAIPLDKDATTYLSFLIAELNQHPKYGQKRSNDPISNEEGAYLFNLLEGAGSAREDKSMVRYTQAVAWLLGQKEANLEHILTVAPYVLWHRARTGKDTLDKLRENKRNDPLELYAMKTLLGDGTAELPGVKKRFLESRENYQTVMNFLHQGRTLLEEGKGSDAEKKFAEAKKATKRFASSGKGHPIFLDLEQDLE